MIADLRRAHEVLGAGAGSKISRAFATSSASPKFCPCLHSASVNVQTWPILPSGCLTTPKGSHPTAQGQRSATLGERPSPTRTLKGFHNWRCRWTIVEPFQGSQSLSTYPRVARRFAPSRQRRAEPTDPGLLGGTPLGFRTPGQNLGDAVLAPEQAQYDARYDPVDEMPSNRRYSGFAQIQ